MLDPYPDRDQLGSETQGEALTWICLDEDVGGELEAEALAGGGDGLLHLVPLLLLLLPLAAVVQVLLQPACTKLSQCCTSGSARIRRFLSDPDT